MPLMRKGMVRIQTMRMPNPNPIKTLCFRLGQLADLSVSKMKIVQMNFHNIVYSVGLEKQSVNFQGKYEAGIRNHFI